MYFNLYFQEWDGKDQRKCKRRRYVECIWSVCIFFNLYHPILENTNLKYEHYHLLTIDLIFNIWCKHRHYMRTRLESLRYKKTRIPKENTTQSVTNWLQQNNLGNKWLHFQNKDPCQNGGTCHGNHQCTCLEVYDGSMCENCKCVNGLCSGDKCICEAGYTGNQMLNFRRKC